MPAISLYVNGSFIIRGSPSTREPTRLSATCFLPISSFGQDGLVYSYTLYRHLSVFGGIVLHIVSGQALVDETSGARGSQFSLLSSRRMDDGSRQRESRKLVVLFGKQVRDADDRPKQTPKSRMFRHPTKILRNEDIQLSDSALAMFCRSVLLSL